MNRIYYNDIDVIKKDYKELFNSQRSQKLQKRWVDARAELIGLGGCNLVYPKKLSDIFVADFENLAKIYFDYIRMASMIPKSMKEDIESIFRYTENRRAKITEFFMNHAKQIGISVCCYCDMSYVNTYRSNNGKRHSHFDLDHVLPKSKCPITSLSLFNLVPCCPVCNQRLKRNTVWFADINEAMISSPSSSQYGFDSKVKYRLIPNNSFRVIRYQENIDFFRVEFHTDSPIYKKMISSLYLDERYDFHKSEALRLLDKIQDYPPTYIKMIHNALCQNGISYSEAKIFEDIFGNKFMLEHNRTFGKLIRDIMKLYK